MSDTVNCVITRSKNRFGELLHQPGGIDKEEAVAAAIQHLELLREEYLKVIPDHIQALEALLAGIGPDGMTTQDIQKLVFYAERLLVLSGTFGCELLDAVVKSFCDLGIGMIEKGITRSEPFEVYLRAMWLVCPQSSNLADTEAISVLNELSKIHAHFNVA